MDEKICLEQLLLDTEVFHELKRFTDDINLFDVLKIANAELKHSIMLAYIFNPSESHSLGSKPLELFFKKLSLHNQISQLSLFDLLDIEYDDFSITREYKHIDLLLKSAKSKIVVCIENKLGTREHSDQLSRYKATIDNEFPEYKKIYLYLTPDGDDASDSETWATVSYEDIVELFDELNLDHINQKVKMLIDDYRLMIKRNIMNDSELKELCNKIYKKHKQALDLIWENKDDDTYYLQSIVNDYLNNKAAEGKINYETKNSSKTYFRFTTSDLEKHFPLLGEDASAWNNKHTVFYEIVVRKTPRVQISFGYKGVDRASRYKDATTYLHALGFQNVGKYREGASYFTKSFGDFTDSETIAYEEPDSEYIFGKLDNILSRVFKKETEL